MESLWVDSSRYFLKRNAWIKACEYRRGPNLNEDGITTLEEYRNPKFYCAQVANGKDKLCKYHSNGGQQLQMDLYFSVRQQRFFSSSAFLPEYNDLRCESEHEVYKYTKQKWRRCCKICWTLAKVTHVTGSFCTMHSPDRTPVVSNTSKIACGFMDRLAAEMNCEIVHKHSTTDSEFKIPSTSYKVDGFIPSQKIVIEFLGDFWHGNPKLYDENTMNISAQKTFGELYRHTFKRFEDIAKLGYKIYYMWEKDYLESPPNVRLLDTIQKFEVTSSSSSSEKRSISDEDHDQDQQPKEKRAKILKLYVPRPIRVLDSPKSSSEN